MFFSSDLNEYLCRDLSEAETLQNFRITPDGRIIKRSGSYLAYTFSDNIRAAYTVVNNDSKYICVLAGNTLFRLTEGENEFICTTIGALVGANFRSENEKAEMFMFNGRLYILAGNEYYCYDSSSLNKVEGYIPLIYRFSTPNGIAAEYEKLNLLTNRVRMTFCPYGTNTSYKLKGNVLSIEAVYYKGSLFTEYTVSFGEATYINFYEPLEESQLELLEVWYTLDVPSQRSRITSCTHSVIYGGDTDSRVFLYGGNDASTVFFSDNINNASKPELSSEYFPESSEFRVGDSNEAVTGAVRQFDRLAIFTENQAFYTYPVELKPESDVIHIVTRYGFPLFPLNTDVGASKQSGAFLCENEPYALNENGLYCFKSTSVRDERLAVRIDIPDFVDITPDTITKCAIYVNKVRGELWFYRNESVGIYNARQKKWYYFVGFTPDIMFDYNGKDAYCSENKLCIFDDSLYSDNGVPFTALVADKNINCGKTFARKRLLGLGVSIDADKTSCAKVNVRTDLGNTLSYVCRPSAKSDAPLISRFHAGIGRFHNLSFELISDTDSPLGAREIIFYYR